MCANCKQTGSLPTGTLFKEVQKRENVCCNYELTTGFYKFTVFAKTDCTQTIFL